LIVAADMRCGSFWRWFCVGLNRSTFQEDVDTNDFFFHFRSIGDLSVKFEVSTALRFRVNRRHGRDDGQTDGQSTTLNAASQGGCITLPTEYRAKI